MLNLQDKAVRGRLLRAVDTSREKMVPFRQVRHELIKDYVGNWYSEGGAENKTLVNLLNQTARIYTVALAANNPQALVSTPHLGNYPFARRFEANLNTLIADMNLAKTFRDIVMDAFFCLGVGCVMMRDSGTQFHGMLESEEDVWLDPGEPWFGRISMDELILDMSAKELTKMRFCGHTYRADFEKVQAEPGYNKAVTSKLSPTSKTARDDPQAAADIATGQAVDDDELKPMIWLMDLWIPENRSIVTMAMDKPELPPLIEREWKGSQAGPYKFLSLGNVPDNAIPAPPAMNLKGLHDLQNRLHRRMEDDSDAHRTVNAYSPHGSDDAETLRKAGRNEWVKINDPKSVQQIELGGVDQRDLALALAIQDTYDRMAGNLTAMGGLGQQAGTLGQEEMIHGQVSRTEADMRMAVVDFASESILDLGRLMWEDQNLELHSSIALSNTGREVPVPWTPGNRVGRFEDYQFRVEPYSMVHKTPRELLAELFQVLERVAPLWPMFQASGATLDAEAIVDEIARMLNRPEIRRIITFAAPMDMSSDPHAAHQSPVTSRETIRKNVPTGGTKDARSAAMQQALTGGKPQLNGAQKAAMGRSPA